MFSLREESKRYCNNNTREDEASSQLNAKISPTRNNFGVSPPSWKNGRIRRCLNYRFLQTVHYIQPFDVASDQSISLNTLNALAVSMAQESRSDSLEVCTYSYLPHSIQMLISMLTQPDRND